VEIGTEGITAVIKRHVFFMVLYANTLGAKELADGCFRVYSGDSLCIERSVKNGVESSDRVLKFGDHRLTFFDKYRSSKLIEIDYSASVYGLNIYQGRDSEGLLVFKISHADLPIEIIRSEPFRGRVFDGNQGAPYFSNWSFETEFKGKCSDGVVAVTKIFFESKLASKWKRCLRSSNDSFGPQVDLGLAEFLNARNACAALPILNLDRLPCGGDFIVDWARRIGIEHHRD
jgi:hypothetical protein